ncbi:hypothetical protein FACS18942_01890 [Planctomycetales bacterium]|nr:hypothetical protein FACS18942_01890 [Planctomycetales bacterium]
MEIVTVKNKLKNEPVFELDEYEQSIENEIDRYKPVSPEKRKKIEDAIDRLNRSADTGLWCVFGNVPTGAKAAPLTTNNQ